MVMVVIGVVHLSIIKFKLHLVPNYTIQEEIIIIVISLAVTDVIATTSLHHSGQEANLEHQCVCLRTTSIDYVTRCCWGISQCFPPSYFASSIAASQFQPVGCLIGLTLKATPPLAPNKQRLIPPLPQTCLSRGIFPATVVDLPCRCLFISTLAVTLSLSFIDSQLCSSAPQTLH